MRERTNDDLCTPQVVIDVVEQVGPIGLDPCSNPWSIVPARVRLSRDEGQDGLVADWQELMRPGELFYVNPPYSRGAVALWIRKIEEERSKGCEGAALLRGDFSTLWWEQALRCAAVIAYWGRRLAHGGGAHGGGKIASALFYFGDRPEAIARAASPFADVRILPRRRRR